MFNGLKKILRTIILLIFPRIIIPKSAPIPSFPWSFCRKSNGHPAPGHLPGSPITTLGDDGSKSFPWSTHYSSFPWSFCRKSSGHLVGNHLPGSPITTLGDDDPSPTTTLEDDVQHSGMTDLSHSRGLPLPVIPVVFLSGIQRIPKTNTYPKYLLNT